MPNLFRYIRSICALSLLLTSIAANAGTCIATWNIKHLGWENGKDMQAVAAVIAHFDLVALQEVMDPAAAKVLADRMTRTTGESWDVLTSEPVGDSKYKEGYAFVWRESAVKYDGGAISYLDPGNHFAREPLSAQFTLLDDQQRITAATVHIVYGDNRDERAAEIRQLDEYWRWLGQNFDAPRMLMGDFNLEPSHPAWAQMRELSDPAMTSGATTLSRTDGRFVNLYDNIWTEKALSVRSGDIFDYPSWLRLTHDRSYARVSDHVPVFVEVGPGEQGIPHRSCI